MAWCAAATWRQVVLWRDSVALWEHALASGPVPGHARINLALALIHRGRADEAVRHLREQARLFPEDRRAGELLRRLLADRSRP